MTLARHEREGHGRDGQVTGPSASLRAAALRWRTSVIVKIV